MAQLVNILLQRSDSSFPWGFRAKVENGCGYSLLVQRVTPGTISSNYLKPGDVILRLNNKQAQELANRDIDEVIKEAGNSLELIICKRPHGNSNPVPYPGPNSPMTPATPPFGNPPTYPVQPPTRNFGHMSPKPTSPTQYYSGSPQNSSPVPYPPSSPTPASPVNCPPPPPMFSGPDSPRGTQPPPPPPPPMPSGQSAPWRATQQQQLQQQQQPSQLSPTSLYEKTHQKVNTGPVNQYDNLPAALQSTLSKDKKPFTYTPGGIDLSELKSPRMQRRIQLNQMDPPRNLAKAPPPPQPDSDTFTSPPPPETYPQPRVQLLPAVHVHNRMPNAPQPVMNRPQQHNRNQSNTQTQKGQQRPASPPRTQAYVHSPYNSPLNLYSSDNVAEAFNAQTGEVLPGFENVQVNKPQSAPSPYSAEDNFTPYYKEQHPQSRSFRLLQVMTDTTNPNEQEEEKMVRSREEDEMKFTGIKRNPIPSRAFQTLQKITGDDNEQSASPPLVEYQPASQVNSCGPENCELRYRGACIPSRSFKILQSMTGGSDDEVMATKTRVPKKTATMNIQVGNGPSTQGYNHSQEPYQGQWVPPSEQQAEAEPKKYMGGHIPSRSFRMLQAMTGGDDANNDYNDSIEIPVQHETTQQESEPRMYMGSNIPSRSFRMLQAMTDPNKE